MKELNIPIIKGDFVDWNKSASIEIEHYPWDLNGYKPKVICHILSTEDNLHLMFEAFEDNIRSEVIESGIEVCQDSCVEFFFQPVPHLDKRYFNFELNPIGTLCLGIGTDHNNWTFMKVVDYKEVFQIKSSILQSKWIISLQIPYSFIQIYFPDFFLYEGSKMKGNFYKCGDLTEYPHFGCWNKVNNPIPDFHLPDHFGLLSFN